MSAEFIKDETAIVLGGTEPHIELIQQLKSRGYYVVLVDYFENPPAKVYADVHEKESTMDSEVIAKIAKKYDANLVISACIDQANSVCCYVAEKLGLPHPYSYDTSILCTVKTEMKRVMVENDILTSKFQAVNDICTINWSKVSFPAVVKPADCNSSKGVRRVESIDEAKVYIINALECSRTGRGIIEDYIKGTEIQVDCFAGDSGAKVMLTRQKKQISREEKNELNSSGSIIPAPICIGKEKELDKIANGIAKAFGLRNTPFFYQAIIEENGDVKVLEFAPRVGGGLSYYILKEIAGFDAVKAVVDSYLGVNQHPQPVKIKSFYSTNLLYMHEGIFDHIVGLEEGKTSGLIKEFFVNKSKGSHIGNQLRSGNRVGAFIVEAGSVVELRQKEMEAYDLISIIDAEGKPQMRKWRN